MPRQYVEEQWQQFFREVLSKADLSAMQIRNRRRLFYAGAIALMSMMLDMHKKGFDEGCDFLTTVNDELSNFAQQEINQSRPGMN